MMLERRPICKRLLKEKQVWTNKKPDKLGVLRREITKVRYCEFCDFTKIPLRVNDYTLISDLMNRFNNVNENIVCSVCGKIVVVKKNSICYDYNMCVEHARQKYFNKNEY